MTVIFLVWMTKKKVTFHVIIINPEIVLFSILKIRAEFANNKYWIFNNNSRLSVIICFDFSVTTIRFIILKSFSSLPIDFIEYDIE